MNGRGEFLRRVTRVLAAGELEDSLAVHLCQSVVETLEAEGGAISLRVGSGGSPARSVLCATNEVAQHFQDAQDLAREGPCYDALVRNRPVHVEDVARVRVRWPRLGDVLSVAGGPRGQLEAVPMRHGHALVGVLSVHHADGSPLAVSATDLQFFADVVGAAVVDEAISSTPAAMRWGERDVVLQATGMVMVQLGISADDALAVLRSRTFAEQTSIAAVARSVVDRSLRFDRPDEEG